MHTQYLQLFVRVCRYYYLQMIILYTFVVYYSIISANLVHTFIWRNSNIYVNQKLTQRQNYSFRRFLRDCFTIRMAQQKESLCVLEQLESNPLSLKQEDSLEEFLGKRKHTFPTKERERVSRDSLLAHKFIDFFQICSLNLNALSEEGINKSGIFFEFADSIKSFWQDGLNIKSMPFERSRVAEYLKAFYYYEVMNSKRTKDIRLKLYDTLPKLLLVGLEWQDIQSTIHEVLFHEKFQSNTDGEEIASFLYAFGQMRNSKSSDGTFVGFDECLKKLMELTVRALESDSKALNSNQFLRMLHGLARSGLQWDELPPQLQKFVTKNYMLSSIIRNRNNARDIVPSLIQSLSVMKMSWSVLHSSTQQAIVHALTEDVRLFSARELANIIWALGKMHFTFEVEEKKSPSDALKHVLLGKVSSSCQITAHAYHSMPGNASPSRDHFSAFDIESIFCGLGLMKISFPSLTSNQKENILSAVSVVISAQPGRDRRIFFLHNCLWGLARMQATKDVIDSVRVVQETETTSFSLSQRLLFSAVENMHAFLPEQLGDVMWALGTMNYSIADLGSNRADRTLAVLSRVFVHLPNRGGASTLWALGSMGFKWKRDFTRSCYSLPQPEGKLAQPLQKSVDKYLYQRVAAMHEQDYGVTLYSLGYLLGMERYGNGSISEEKSGHTLRKVVWDKVDKRLERLAKFFSSRSLSQALKGFSRTGVHWADLPTQMRSAWEASLLAHINDSTGARARGLAGMHRMQLAETIFSLGMLRCRWVEMSPALQSEIRKCLDRDFIVYKQSITSMESAQASTVHTAAAEFDFYPEVEAAPGVPIVFHETLLAYYAVEGLLRIEYPANDFPVALVDYSESHVKTTELQEKAPQQLSKERKANYETFKRCLYYCRGLRATLQHNGSLI